MFLVQVVDRGSTPRGIRRHYAQWLKAGLMTALLHWHTVYRPLHFREAAYHRYPIYNLREKRDRKPLYQTGESFRASERQDFRGTSKSMRAVYRLPRLNFGAAGTFRKKGETRRGKRINMRGEFTAVNNPEQVKLNKVLMEDFMRRVRLFRAVNSGR